ncbi:MAG: hypothetical protein WDN48_09045 [Pseudolabrys sp.]
MPKLPIQRETAFIVMDVARMLRTYADQRARQFGISRAQWTVLVRPRSPGRPQAVGTRRHPGPATDFADPACSTAWPRAG